MTSILDIIDLNWRVESCVNSQPWSLSTCLQMQAQSPEREKMSSLIRNGRPLYHRNGEHFANVKDNGEVLDLGRKVIGFVDEEGDIYVEGKKLNVKFVRGRNPQPVNKITKKTRIIISSAALLVFIIGVFAVFTFVNKRKREEWVTRVAVAKELSKKYTAEKESAAKDAAAKEAALKEAAARYNDIKEMAEAEIAAKDESAKLAVEKYMNARKVSVNFESMRNEAAKEESAKKKVVEYWNNKEKDEKTMDERNETAVKAAQKEVTEKETVLEKLILRYNTRRYDSAKYAVAQNIISARASLQEANIKYNNAMAARRPFGTFGIMHNLGEANARQEAKDATMKHEYLKNEVKRHRATVVTAMREADAKKAVVKAAVTEYAAEKKAAMKEVSAREADARESAEKYAAAKVASEKYEAEYDDIRTAAAKWL